MSRIYDEMAGSDRSPLWLETCGCDPSALPPARWIAEIVTASDST